MSIGGERGGGRQVSAALPDKCLSLARKTAMWETGQPLGVVVGARLRVVHNTQELKLKLLNFGQGRKILPPSSLGGEGVRQARPERLQAGGKQVFRQAIDL